MPILLAHSSETIPAEVVPIVAIVLTFLWLMVKAVMAPFTQRARLKAERGQNNDAGGGLTAEEHAALANLQRTLANMERRVESLETILIETQRAK